MLVLVKETLGDDWLTPDRFRIGASSVLNDLLMQYAKLDERPLRPLRGLLEGVTRWPRAGSAHARASRWDYAPAPESRDSAALREPLRPVHRRRSSSRPRTARYEPTINPATEEPLAEVAFAGPTRRRRAPSAAARAALPAWAGAAARSSAASTCSASRA